ncbi:uncharacterized protein LOC116376722 [Oncorhynchus kisutch]|uniref:uncharacterized protein LOC116376722 n=1 Tax=Oncorhynchus kisutch TaxID=8019 RepID=UPI0012DE47B0|nr:uncharacterized protein LOC116376722 [Oncorhynchus kisutch]
MLLWERQVKIARVRVEHIVPYAEAVKTVDDEGSRNTASEMMEAADDYTIFQMVEEQGHLLHQYHDQLGLLGTTMKEVLLVVNRLDNTSKMGDPTKEMSKVATVISLLTGRRWRVTARTGWGSGPEFLPWAEYAQNSLRHSTTRLTLSQCILGYQLAPGSLDSEPKEAPAIEAWFRRQKDQAVHHRSEAPVFHPGDHVWPSIRNLPFHLPEAEPLACGALQGWWFLVPWLMLSPAIPLPWTSRTPTYAVRSLHDSQCCGGRLQYLVEWEGYSPDECFWGPVADIPTSSIAVVRPAPRPWDHPPGRCHLAAGAARRRGGGITTVIPTPSGARCRQSTNHQNADHQ